MIRVDYATQQTGLLYDFQTRASSVLITLESLIERWTELDILLPRRRDIQKFKDQPVEEVVEFSKPITKTVRE